LTKLVNVLVFQIEQDFVQLFGEETSAKFLEKWPTTFKQKIIQLTKSLTSKGDELLELIERAESTFEGAETDADGKIKMSFAL